MIARLFAEKINKGRSKVWAAAKGLTRGGRCCVAAVKPSASHGVYDMRGNWCRRSTQLAGTRTHRRTPGMGAHNAPAGFLL